MGFYLELSRKSPEPEYRENFVPFVYFGLLGFSALALVGMGAAAHGLLAQLANEGGAWDAILVYGPLACLPVVLLFALKLAGMRKYIRFEGDHLTWGYRLFGKPVLTQTASRDEVAGLEMENHRPKGNLAPRHHDDPTYYVRGHWRLLLVKKNGEKARLDRHTEQEALVPLFDDLNAWLKA